MFNKLPTIKTLLLIFGVGYFFTGIIKLLLQYEDKNAYPFIFFGCFFTVFYCINAPAKLKFSNTKLYFVFNVLMLFLTLFALTNCCNIIYLAIFK